MNEDQEYTVGRVIFLDHLVRVILLCLDEELQASDISEKVLGRMETFFDSAKKKEHPDRASILAMQHCLENLRNQIKGRDDS